MKTNNDLKKVFDFLFENLESDVAKSVEDVEVQIKDLSKLHSDVGEMLEKASKTPTNWADIFQAVEEFRNDLLSDDRQDSSATEAQMALVVPLIAYFVLVLETDILALPNETRIFIDLIKDNFSTPKQVDRLKHFLSVLHPGKF